MQNSKKRFKITNHQMQMLIGNSLRFGVILAAVIVVLGGLIYLRYHAFQGPINYSTFNGVKEESLTHVIGIVKNTFSFHGKGLIQLGLLILIATPIFRVAISIFAFALQKDYLYVLVTLIVFLILIYGLLNS